LRKIAPFLTKLWQHRELLWQFTLRNVELRHRGSHLGLVWSFLSPLLLLGLYVLVFGFFLEGTFGVRPNETRVEYGLGIFFGLTLFHFVAEILGVAPGLIVGNPNFVKKVVFPLEILPAASVLGSVFHLIISLGLVLAGIVLWGAGLGPRRALAASDPFPVGPADARCELVILRPWGVFSGHQPDDPVSVHGPDVLQRRFYPATKIAESSPAAWAVLRFNPVLLANELARDAALWSRPLNFDYLFYLYAVGLAACYLGYAIFRRMKPAFADVL
jgi:lipopolysaccharide transport system permease protein